MPQFRIVITPHSALPGDKPLQLFAPTLISAKAEVKKWGEKKGPAKYRITETVEKVVEEGEC